MNLPVSFIEFAKDPVKGMLFFAIIALGYLYFDNKVVYKDVIHKQELRIEILEAKVDTLENRLLNISRHI